MPYPLFYVRALLDADAIECQEVAVKRSNRPRRAGKYRGWGEGGSPESSRGRVLCLIEPDPLLVKSKLKICFSLPAFTQVAQLNETIAVWH